MSHLTLGHFLYVVAALEIVTMVPLGLSQLNNPEPEREGAAGTRRIRGMLFIFAGVTTAILLCVIGTFADVGKIQLF